MKIAHHSLLEELSQYTRDMIAQAEDWRELPDSVLNAQPAPEKWSALQCLEHLNRYGAFYLPEFDKAVARAPKAKGDSYNTGWLGKMAAEGMLPKEGKKMKTMKTFKSKHPAHSEVSREALDEFLRQQEATLIVLSKLKGKALGKTRVPTTLGKLVKMKLGDILRFVVYHNVRHIQQARAALEAAKSPQNH